MTCVNCGYHVVEEYCARCGQPRRPERLHMWPMVREAADAVFNLDSGLHHTILTMSRRPGHVVLDYLAGRTRPYTGPAKYLIICVAVATFASVLSGFTGVQAEQVTATAPDAAEDIAYVFDTLQRYSNLILLLGLPILPLLSRALFRASGLNLMEHLVFNTYVYAHQNLIMLLVLPTYFLLDAMVATLIYGLAMTIYYVWAARQTFGFGWVSTALRGTLVMFLFTVIYIMAMAGGMKILTAGRAG